MNAEYQTAKQIVLLLLGMKKNVVDILSYDLETEFSIQ